MMKFIRFVDSDGIERHGTQQEDGSAGILTDAPVNGGVPTGKTTAVAKLLAPVVPPAILAIGLNYRMHAEETHAKIPDYPILFVKTPNSLQNPGDPISLPTHLKSDQVDYECELAVVIGKTCKNVSKERALDYVLGYTCGNDVSARDWQKGRGGGQWCKGKGFDTFCPLGPVIVTPEEIPNPNSLGIKTVLNGVEVQSCNTADMIFDVPTLIEFLSGSATLLPGTVILTGTPHGVGMGRTPPLWLKPGDTVSIVIDSIGTLTNPVVDEA